MRARTTFAVALALVLGMSPSAFAAPAATPEQEQNGDSGTATALDPSSKDCYAVGSGGITPATDADFWSFPAQAGSLTWAHVETLGSTTGPDSFLDLLDTNGTTLLETDDDDGARGPASSLIAGKALPNTGTAFLKVVEFGNDGTITPYRIFLTTTSTAAVPEVEANNTAPTANAIPGCKTPVSGAIAPGDVDFYSVSLTAGQTAFFVADGDPERNDTVGTNVNLALVSPAGSDLIAIDSNANFFTPTSEGAAFDVTETGVHTVRVTADDTGTTTGTYQLLVGKEPAPSSGSGSASGSGSSSGPPATGLPGGFATGPSSGKASVSALPGNVTIDLSTGKGTGRLLCQNVPADVCKVSLNLQVGGTASASAKKKKRKRAVKLGTAKGTIPGGKRGTVRFSLSRKGIARLKRARKLRVQAVGGSRNRAGARTGVKKAITLKAKARKRKRR